jgi:hypothetical protein
LETGTGEDLTNGFPIYNFEIYNGLDVQLLNKSKGNQAEKLGTISLLKANFNLNNKVIISNTSVSGGTRQTITQDHFRVHKG